MKAVIPIKYTTMPAKETGMRRENKWYFGAAIRALPLTGILPIVLFSFSFIFITRPTD
jgi:hypothetical protein